MKLSDYINSKQIALYISNLPAALTLDEALFPNDTQLSMELEMAKGANSRPVALKISRFDVAAKVRALNAEITVEKKEMPFFKEAIGINETQRREIIQAQQANNENLVQFILKKVFDNYAELVAGADVQAKRMRAQVLQNGSINISSDEGDIVVDYGVTSNHKQVLSGSSAWSQAGADIIGDISKWQKVFTDEGKGKPTRLVMTEDTFLKTICFNTAIKNDLATRIIGAQSAVGLVITEQEFKDYLKKRFGIDIGFVDGTFVNETGQTVSYYESGKVTFIPVGTLGRTIYSVTPEEYDKKFGSAKIDTEVVKTGIAITTMVKEDPVAVDTKVSQIVLPSFERADECFFATVY